MQKINTATTLTFAILIITTGVVQSASEKQRPRLDPIDPQIAQRLHQKYPAAGGNLDVMLIDAVEDNNIPVIKKTLQLGANPNYLSRHEIPVLYSHYSLQAAQLVTKAGADILSGKNNTFKTSLINLIRLEDEHDCHDPKHSPPRGMLLKKMAEQEAKIHFFLNHLKGQGVETDSAALSKKAGLGRRAQSKLENLEDFTPRSIELVDKFK